MPQPGSTKHLRSKSRASHCIGTKRTGQILSLLEAWLSSPKNKKTRQFRKKILWKMRHNKPLTVKDRNALNGLDALGLTSNGTLTSYGRYFIQNEGNLPSPKPAAPCVIESNKFIAPLHTYPNLLWQLELHLRPSTPGMYSLTKRALHFHPGDPIELIQLLEEGLKNKIPDQIRALILEQPSIRIAEGIVLEFSSPAELAQLRRQPVLRKYFEEFLSSQRVLIAQQNAKAVYELLKRRGVYVHRNEDQTAAAKTRRTHFPQNPLVQPVGKRVSKLALIEKYKQLGQALDMHYRAPGCAPEKRRITPLAIEQRGEHTYIIALRQRKRRVPNPQRAAHLPIGSHGNTGGMVMQS